MGGLGLGFLGVLGRGLGRGGLGLVPCGFWWGLRLGGLRNRGSVSWGVLGQRGTGSLGLDLGLGSGVLGVGEFGGVWRA